MKNGPALICENERRRHDVRAAGKWNGLDYVEVGQSQVELTVYFLGQAPAQENLRLENIVIEPCGGGEPVELVDFKVCDMPRDDRDDCLHLTLRRPGGFGPHRLCLVEVDLAGRPTGEPYPGFDARYACVEFDFKVDCETGLDCREEKVCPPEPSQEPVISYLAKDYASFRQLILDRLAVTLPDWRERHVPDVGIALVELLAYVGDHLSYYQDAVGTEAYLDTARRRISVRRHVRLVDYEMHEGCNARAWVFVETSADQKVKDFYFITGFAPEPPEGKALGDDDLRGVRPELYLTFEPVLKGEVSFHEAHNEILLYTWGDRECCLPKGATRAVLKDTWLGPPPQPRKPPHGSYSKEVSYGSYEELDLSGPFPEQRAYGFYKETEDVNDQDDDCGPPVQTGERERRLKLKAGDLLLFEEVLGPKTGHPSDADRAHRHVVRLIDVKAKVDGLYDQPILEIEWAREDALPFPLCVSAIGGEHCRFLPAVSVARGNVLLVDHGRTVKDEDLGSVEPADTPSRCEGEGRLAEEPQITRRFAPVLKQAPLTFRQPPLEDPLIAARRLIRQDPRKALPELSLGGDWKPMRDLMDSRPGDSHFAAEVDDDGRAHLRFGDGDRGIAPVAGAAFQATYRVGNGRAGNVGAGAIRHLALRGRNRTLSGVTLRPRNPLPAQGGADPEPVAEVRLLAPHAFRKDLRRAITAEDYARLAEREFEGRVQRAAAVLRWTGSWTEVLVAVDPMSGEGDVDGLLREIGQALQRYRRIGHDVVVTRAVSVGLDIELAVCVKPDYVKGHVEAALREALGSRTFFHPDKLSFGEGIALSKLIAAAQAVTGVDSVEVKKFQRLYGVAGDEIEKGFLPLGPLEIARMDNDPRFPDNGRLKLTMGGGR